MSFSMLRRTSSSLFRSKIRKKSFQVANISDHERNMIGKREIVGYGFNGQPTYVDRMDFPFPAVRWKEPTCEIDALHEKEKGDWNELTCEEKKALYRASFCQTYTEMKISNQGEWKSVMATTCLLMVPALLIFYYWKVTIYCARPLPESFQEDRREAQFRRYLDLKMNPIQGLASKWDYEKDDWKDPRDPWKPKT